MHATRDQKGFGLVEVVVIAVVLILIVVGGWYVWGSGQRSQDSQNNSTSDNANKTPDDNQQSTTYATFSQPPAPFTFKHLKTWVVQPADNVQPGQPLPDRYRIFLKTPDIEFTEVPIGGSVISKGARITLLVSKTQLTNIQDIFTDLRAHAQGKSNTSVAGIPAVQYEFGYESQSQRYTDFIKDGYLYSIGYGSANDERTSASFEDYVAIVASFNFE